MTEALRLTIQPREEDDMSEAPSSPSSTADLSKFLNTLSSV